MTFIGILTEAFHNALKTTKRPVKYILYIIHVIYIISVAESRETVICNWNICKTTVEMLKEIRLSNEINLQRLCAQRITGFQDNF